MAPVAVLQPEPLEGILLFHGDELLSEGIHVGSFSHLLLDECNETLWIDFQFNLLSDRTARDVHAPTVVLVLDECRMSIHHQLAQLTL